MTLTGLVLCVYAALLLAGHIKRSADEPAVTRLVWER